MILNYDFKSNDFKSFPTLENNQLIISGMWYWCIHLLILEGLESVVSQKMVVCSVPRFLEFPLIFQGPENA